MAYVGGGFYSFPHATSFNYDCIWIVFVKLVTQECTDKYYPRLSECISNHQLKLRSCLQQRQKVCIKVRKTSGTPNETRPLALFRNSHSRGAVSQSERDEFFFDQR